MIHERYYKSALIIFGLLTLVFLLYYRTATNRYVRSIDLTEPLREATKVSKKRMNLNYQDRQRFYRVLKWPESCENQFSSSTLRDFAGIAFYEVAPGYSLVVVQCNQGGNFGGISQYLWLNETKEPFTAQLLNFVSYVKDENALSKTTTSALVGEPIFNPQTRLLTVVRSFQININCGVATTYKLENNAALLVQARGTTQCYYPGNLNASSWPTLPL